MKRTFGMIEAVFDAVYLLTAVLLGGILLVTARQNDTRMLAGIMALVLAGGDAFHLVPRMVGIVTGREETLRRALGIGKQITSVTMTVFYLLLWQIGLRLSQPADGGRYTAVIAVLALVRVGLCLLPQNRWQDQRPPVSWGILRNIPFFLQGAMVALLFGCFVGAHPGMEWMWLAIILSFACYLPVVLWANRSPKIGMLMLPKTCAYVWMIVMCLSL